MREQAARQFEQMLTFAKDARIPENFQAFSEESLAKARETYSKFNTTAKDNVKALEDLFQSAQANAKEFGQKILNNTARNIEAAFDAAQELARAKTLPEAARIQADFAQQQLAAANAQAKELFDLSAKYAHQTLEAAAATAAKACSHFKTGA